jgi:hypothetical protein
MSSLCAKAMDNGKAAVLALPVQILDKVNHLPDTDIDLSCVRTGRCSLEIVMP